MERMFRITNRLGPMYIIRLMAAGLGMFMLPANGQTAGTLSLQLPASAYQGDMVVGTVLPQAAVFVGERQAPVSRDGYFVIGIERTQPTDVTVSARRGDEDVRHTIRILARDWDIQRIDGLARSYVHPDPEQARRIEADNRLIAGVREGPLSMEPWFLERASSSRSKGG